MESRLVRWIVGIVLAFPEILEELITISLNIHNILGWSPLGPNALLFRNCVESQASLAVDKKHKSARRVGASGSTSPPGLHSKVQT